jgi:hypothetical protein
MSSGTNGLGRTADELSTRRGGGTGDRAIGSVVDPLERGGFGHSGQEGVPGSAPGGGGTSDIESSSLPGNPHSMHGFRHAIMKSQHSGGGGAGHGLGGGGRLLGKVRNASRMFQGGRTHGVHVGGMGIHGSGGLKG